MEQQHQDEQITCASCGTSFTFAAADASARAARGLTSPPTLCKPCWREKNVKNATHGGAPREDAQPNRRPRGPAGQGDGRDVRPRPAPRFTGDVNEYRSPMADPHFATYPSYARRVHPSGQTPRAHGPRDDGNYRAPSFHNEPGRSIGHRAAPRSADGHGPSREHGFPITCAACGNKAKIPFKPNENQKVYCRACYRADKPT